MKRLLQNRTKQFALTLIDFTEHLPKNHTSSLLSKHLIKSAIALGANYRAVCRSRSDQEFIIRMNSVLCEADTSAYCLEIIGDKNWVPIEDIAPLRLEADELCAIFTSSLKTISTRVNKLR